MLEIAERQGFLDPAGRIPFEKRRGYRTSKIVGTDILTLDLLLMNAALEDVWNGREVYCWKGLDVQVVSAQGLVKMKRMAGRDQDLLDVKKLESHDAEDREPPADENNVDMSAEAIDQRLRDLAQLYKLGMSLRDVKLVGKATDLRRETGGDGPRAAPAAPRAAP